MPQLHLENIDKHYGDLHVVKDVSLEVPAGEFVVLVGPSGCGKSTLLRSIAGLEEISAGSISLGGREISRLAPRERNIAMVFQSYALYPYLTVYENIAFGLRARKFSSAHIEKRVKWAAEVLDIGPYLERYPRELSGGQRQRVAIGRSIVRDADLYLFDEPLSNLDAKLRDGMREEIKKLHEALGKTFIYVTHDQIEAMTLAQRIVLLRDGRIEQAGAPLDLFEKPASQYVASFLGSPSMNFLEVTVDTASDAVVFTDGSKIPFAGSHKINRPASGRTYLLGVRPEHFRFGGERQLDVEVSVIQPTGSRSYATFFVGGSHCIAELEAHAVTRVGESVSLSVAMDRTILIDPETGRTLSVGSNPVA